MQNRKPSEDELHYKSLITLFKYTVTILGVIGTLFGLALGFMTYSDGREMREALREQRKEMRDEVLAMKLELRDSKQLMKDEMGKLISQTDSSVKQTKNDALNQISGIKESSTVIAKSEAQKSINNVFDAKNIDQYINTIAKERMEPQIKSLVDNTIADAKLKQKKSMLENLKSGDRLKMTIGLTTIQLNPDMELTETELSSIISNVVNTKDESLINTLAAIFLMRKSTVINEFFINALKMNRNGLIQTTAVQYFIINNDIKSIQKYIELMKPSANLKDIYYFLIEQATSLNHRVLLSLLNDKEMIDFIYNKIGLADFQVFIKEIRYVVANKMDSKLINATYFFKR